MINLDPQRLVASIHKYVVVKKKQPCCLLVTTPCTSHGSNTFIGAPTLPPTWSQCEGGKHEHMSLSSSYSYSYYYYILGFASLKGQLGLQIVKSSRNSLGRQGKSWQRRRPESLLPTQSGLSWSTQKWEKTMATPYPPLPSPHGLHPFRGLTLTHQSVGPWGREYKSEWTRSTNLDLPANIERARGGGLWTLGSKVI